MSRYGPGGTIPSLRRTAELAIDRLTRFKYRMLGIMTGISAIGAFIGWFFPKKRVWRRHYGARAHADYLELFCIQQAGQDTTRSGLPQREVEPSFDLWLDWLRVVKGLGNIACHGLSKLRVYLISDRHHIQKQV